VPVERPDEESRPTIGRASAGRRRGAELEAAILEAAWSELTAVGYAALTMEGVATRAKTSRAVLYRRWPSRPELVIAARRHQTTLASSDAVPDTGTLRGDVLAILQHISASVGEIAGALSFMIADYFSETGLPASVLRERVIAGQPGAMQIVLDRAARRGEIDPARLVPRIVSLPVDLVRHELVMRQAPVPEASLIEIVDQVFLPLIVNDSTVCRPVSRHGAGDDERHQTK
jgi:AcrR family transcriptional regulator